MSSAFITTRKSSSNAPYPIVLNNFSEWSISVWTKQPEDVAIEFIEVMQPALGQVTCILKACQTMFQDELSLVRLIEDHARVIVELQAPEPRESSTPSRNIWNWLTIAMNRPGRRGREFAGKG
jgi:hypothetical protein